MAEQVEDALPASTSITIAVFMAFVALVLLALGYNFGCAFRPARPHEPMYTHTHERRSPDTNRCSFLSDALLNIPTSNSKKRAAKKTGNQAVSPDARFGEGAQLH